MKIAYLASIFPHLTMTFVINEVEEHHRAGVDMLPLSCDPPPTDVPFSRVAQFWCDRTVYPPSAGARIGAVLREGVTHPLAMLSCVGWMLRLLVIDPMEFAKSVRELGAAACLAPACRRHGTELIHVHFASRSLSTGILLGRLTGAGVSCTAHAFDLWTRSGRNLRFRLGACAFVAVISRYNLDYIRRHCGEQTARLCHVVHCGIDMSLFDTAGREPTPGRLVLVSAFTEKKGHRHLVEACGMLKQRGVSFECLLIGRGPEEERIRRQIADLDLEDCVKLLGPMANDQLRPYLNTAVAFPLPAVVASDGDQDGIPVALMEAMACGVPVVSTTVSGIPELIRDGEAGLLVPDRDAAALADALERVLTDAALAGRLSVAGRRAVEGGFDIQKTAARLRELFAEAVRGGAGHLVPRPAATGA